MINVTIQPKHHREPGRCMHGHGKRTSNGNFDADVEEDEHRKQMNVLQCKYLPQMTVFTLVLLCCGLSDLSQALFKPCKR